MKYKHTTNDNVWGRQLSRMYAQVLLGKPLPEGAVIHHVGGDQKEVSDIVICQDAAYHMFLHERLRALKSCGDKNKRQCKFCKKWDNQENLYRSNGSSFHPDCINAYNRERRRRTNYNAYQRAYRASLKMKKFDPKEIEELANLLK